MLLEERPCLVLTEISARCNASEQTTPAGSAGDGGRPHAHREERAATELGLQEKQNQKAKSERGRGSSRVFVFLFLFLKKSQLWPLRSQTVSAGEKDSSALWLLAQVPLCRTPALAFAESQALTAESRGALGPKLIRSTLAQPTSRSKPASPARAESSTHRCKPLRKQNLCFAGSIPSGSWPRLRPGGSATKAISET